MPSILGRCFVPRFAIIWDVLVCIFLLFLKADVFVWRCHYRKNMWEFPYKKRKIYEISKFSVDAYINVISLSLTNFLHKIHSHRTIGSCTRFCTTYAWYHFANMFLSKISYLSVAEKFCLWCCLDGRNRMNENHILVRGTVYI